MPNNPLDADFGAIPDFQDTRTPVTGNAQAVQIGRAEDKRQMGVDLNQTLNKIESTAALADQLGKLGIHMGEQAAISKFLGEADNEAEAVALIEQQGNSLVQTWSTMTELAQARSQGVVSYDRAQAEMQLLLRKAKNDNP